MASDPAHSPSPEETTKVDAVKNDPNKLQGYGSAPGVVDDLAPVVDHKAERRLCRRFDIRLLPILAIMCRLSFLSRWLRAKLTGLDLFNALDKGNLGNAETDGMTKGI